MKMKSLLVLLVMMVLVLMTVKGALGAVVINEIMKDPSTPLDADGEYIELYNTGDSPVDLEGWTLQDNGTDTHVINNGAPLMLMDEAYLVLCRNANTSQNGNVTCDYEYTGFTLANAADEVILMDGINEIDRVEYDDGVTFPDPINASMELNDVTLDNNDGANWRTALVAFGDGDLGTPGAINNHRPVYTSTPVTAVDEDAAYTYTVTTTDADGDALTLTATRPAWLNFVDNGDGTGLLSGTPDNGDVGNHNVVIRVSDGYAPAVQQPFTITVNNINDAPVANAVTDNVNEDTEASVTLDYTEIDVGDQAETCTVSGVVGGTQTTACACVAGVCTVGLTPLQDSVVDVTANFIVNDGEVNSNSATITVNINPVDDAPVVAGLVDQTINEGGSFAVFDLDDYLTEVDGNGIIWSASGQVDLNVDIDGDNVVTITAPNADWNGAETITFRATDDTAGALFDTDDALFTVIAVNDDPVANDDTFNVDEDIPTRLNVLNNDDDVDVGDTMTINAVGNPAHGTAVIDGDRIRYTSDQDYNGEDTFVYSVRDTAGATDTATVTVTVTPVNDAPVVVAPVDLDVSEEVEFTVNVVATDVDNVVGDLSINEAASTIDGVAINTLGWASASGLTLTATHSTPGDYVVSLVVTDGTDDSAPVTFDLTVHPAVELLTTAMVVNGVVYDPATEVNVSPGEEVTVNFGFLNNYDQELGYLSTRVDAEAAVAGLFGDLPYLGTCDGVVCDNGHWVLEPGLTATDSFTFTVPWTITQDFFVTVNVRDDRFWQQFLGTAFDDNFVLNFNIVREETDVVITDENVLDENLTCMRTLQLDVEVLNIGDSDFTVDSAPVILVYDRPAIVSSFDEDNGRFTAFAGGTPMIEVRQTVGALASTAQVTVRVNVDTIDLAKGAHNLYIYVVNPHFGSGNYYIGDQSTVGFNIGDCLNVTALEEFFVLAKNAAVGKSADMNDYIIEDTPALYNFNFGLDAESNVQLVDCDLVSPLLSCGSPVGDLHGSSTLTISVDETSVPALSPVVENFDVTVTPTLDVTQVLINNQPVVNGQTTSMLPDEDFTMVVTVRNELSHRVTGIGGSFNFGGQLFMSTGTINLEAGQSGTLTLQGQVPLGICGAGCDPNGYPADLTIQGRDFIDNTLIQSDVFAFDVIVGQAPADVLISDLTLADPDGITCAPSTRLTVELTNRGANNENDLMMTVTGGNVDLAAGPLAIARNTVMTQDFDLAAGDLLNGNNVLTVGISYRDDSTTDSETINLVKGNCLTTVDPAGTSLVLGDGEAQTFTVTLAEAGYASVVEWFVDDVSVLTGQESYVFSQAVAGDYALRVEVNGQETHTWNIHVTNLPVSNNFNTNIPETATDAELASFAGLMIENGHGRIIFNAPVDLRNIDNLDEVVVIGPGLAGIDAANAAGLSGRAATISLFNTGITNPLVKRTNNFVNAVVEVTDVTTIAATAVNGVVTFDVPGFSTYAVLQDAAADLVVPTEVVFALGAAGDTVEQTFTVNNPGARDSVDNIQLTSTADAAYQVQFDDGTGAALSTFTLGPGGVQTVHVTAVIPENTTGGRELIGYANFAYGTDAKTVPIYIQTASVLEIVSIELNGKKSGEFKPGEDNEIEVKVRNNGVEDLEEVAIVVTIEEIDDDADDLDEESDEFEIDAGEKETESFDFDIDADIEEDDYKVVVEVELDGDLIVEEEKTFEVDREKHKLVIKSTSMPGEVSCINQASLSVDVENQGKNDEDEVTVRVFSAELGIELEESELEIEKFSDRDNEERVHFNLDLSSVEPGTNGEVLVEVYRDGDKLEDSKTLSLAVNKCVTTSARESTTETYLTEEVLNQMRNPPAGPTESVPSTTLVVKESFRDTCAYQALLAVLFGLVLVATILSLVVVFRRR